MREYFLSLERIRKASTVLRKTEATFPIDDSKIREVKSILHEILDGHARRWPEPIDGECSCSVEGSEGCRPKVCPNIECDTIIEGADFCSRECSDGWANPDDHSDNYNESTTILEAAERLNRRLKDL